MNVVVSKCTAILELLSSKDETLLIGWDTFLVLNLSFDVVDGVRWFDIEGDCLTGERLDENLFVCKIGKRIQLGKKVFRKTIKIPGCTP